MIYDTPTGPDDRAPDVPTVALVLGHHPRAQGATSVDGTTEYAYNQDLRDIIARRVDANLCEVAYVDRRRPRVMPYKEVNASGCDFFVSLHFNAHEDPQVNGTETLYCGASDKSKRFAKIVQIHMGSALLLRNRSAKAIWSPDALDEMSEEEAEDKPTRGWPLLWRTRMPGVIAEPGFGTNDGDWEVLTRDKGYLAHGLAQAINVYAYKLRRHTA